MNFCSRIKRKSIFMHENIVNRIVVWDFVPIKLPKFWPKRNDFDSFDSFDLRPWHWTVNIRDILQNKESCLLPSPKNRVNHPFFFDFFSFQLFCAKLAISFFFTRLLTFTPVFIVKEMHMFLTKKGENNEN